MVDREEGYFRGFDGGELFFQSWKARNSVGTLVVTHGLGEHSEAYHRLAEAVVSNGWDVWAHDLRGHGWSVGQRGFIRQFDDYVRDTMEFIHIVSQQSSKKPIVLLGHSLGGLINLRTILKGGGIGLRAMALSSPLLGISVRVPTIKKKAAELVAKYVPTFTLYNELPFRIVTRDKAVIDEYDRDPMRHDRISANLYLGMLDVMKDTARRSQEIILPTLIQQAGNDEVVNRKATEDFYQNLGAEDKKIIVYEKHKHEVFNDLGREKVFADLNAWLGRWV